MDENVEETTEITVNQDVEEATLAVGKVMMVVGIGLIAYAIVMAIDVTKNFRKMKKDHDEVYTKINGMLDELASDMANKKDAE